MKKRVITMLMVLILLGTSALIGCGTDSTEDSISTTTEESREELEAEESMAYEPITIDNYGKEITITQKPERVVTLGPNCTELFVALGLSDLIIGTSLNNHSRGALPEYKEIYDAIPELTHSEVTREAIMTSGADFIYGIDWEFGGEAFDDTDLEASGIVAYMNAATTMEEIYQEITDLGKIFEIEDVAEAFIAEQKARIQAVEEIVSAQAGPIKVLVYDSGSEGIFTCSGINFETLLIEYAGGKNIFDDMTERQWITVSYEEVLAREPDVILIHDYDAPSVEEKIAEIKANPTLATLDCVKNERFAVISLASVLPGNRMAFAIESLARDFYPEAFE